MPEPRCLHETDLATIATDIAYIKVSQANIEKRQEKVLSLIFGNGKEGVHTMVARNRDAIKRQWWAVSLVIAALVGFAIKNFLIP